MNLSLLKKIRCRFLDRSTGLPVPGVIASLAVGVGDGTKSAQFPVATLCTDATGYVSFDLKPLIDLGLVAASGFLISAPKFGLTRYDLLGSLVTAPPEEKKSKEVEVNASKTASLGREIMMNIAKNMEEGKEAACIVFPIYLESSLQDDTDSETPTCMPARLPSIQSPDMCDYKVSPFSFVSPRALNLDNDCCEVLVPSSLPIQQYRFNKIIVRREEPAPGMMDNTTDDTTLTRNVKILEPLKARMPVIKFGEILEYKQDWFSLGHSLGEIKYSLPLAPGESTQLAVIEWSRDDLASRTDQIKATEFLDHDSRRDRAIEETVETALKEEQGGNSHMGSTSGIASGSTYGTGMWTGNHAFGGGISYSYGKRNLEGESLQDIHDRVRQATSSVRSLNSTVIVQAAQTESNSLQTRRVANHNHCHALTIQYYEVLRQFRLSTRFAGRRKAVLLPFEPFPFTWQNALRFRTVLEQVLLDPSLGYCFEALIRLHVAPPSVYDVPEQPKPDTGTHPTTPATLAKSVEVKGTKEAGVNSGIMVKKDDKITMSASGLLAVSQTSGGYGSGGFGPGGDGQTAPGGGSNPFIAPGLTTYSLIYKIGLLGPWRQGSATLEIKADREGEIIFGVNDQTGYFADNEGTTAKFWTVNVGYPSHEAEPTPVDASKSDPAQALPFTKNGDLLCEARLITHLKSNQGFYNSAIWTLMNGVERRLYLEEALQDRPDILQGMDDTPLALSGNYVAFAYSGPLVQWKESREEDPTEPTEDIVTLPTRGLFAEAQLGHCNSCEKRDVTRMWDWTVMTTETPPDISGISPGPKGTAPAIAQGQLPGNVIQITQPQAAPDPTALANALGVLKTPDIFRDMAGLSEVSQLLGELAKTAGDANSKAMALQAKSKVDGMKGSGGTTAANSTGTALPSEPDAGKQIDKLDAIQYAKDKGLIDQNQGSDAAQGILGGESSPTVQYVSTDAGIDALPMASAALSDAIVGDPTGQIDLSRAVIDYLTALGSPGNGSCVAVSASYFTLALKRIGAKTLSVTTDGTPVEMPVIATANGNSLSGRPLVTLWFSNATASNWLNLPKRCRGAGAPGALLYADLVANRTILTSNTGWPTGMLPGAHLQLWSTEAEYEELRDSGAVPGLGHSCVFHDYVQGDATRILVSDQSGIAHSVKYPYFGLKYVLAANLSKARLVSFI